MTHALPIAPPRVALWMEAARPRTLSASAAPVIIGTTLAWMWNRPDGQPQWNLSAAALALLGALAIQLACNFANDAADAEKGADAHDRLGPRRLVASGLISARAMRVAAAVAALIGFSCAVLLAMRAGWPLVALGALSALLAWAYTSGPFPLAYHGLGDVFVLVFFGPVAVSATFYVQTLQWDWLPVWLGLAPGLLAVGILAINNLRDAAGDAAVGKRTLAVRFGLTFARGEYLGAVAASAVVVLAVSTGTGLAWLGIGLIGPLSLLPQLRSVSAGLGGTALNDVLAATGRALAIQAAGIAAAGWLTCR